MEGLAAYNMFIKPVTNKRKRAEEEDVELFAKRRKLSDGDDLCTMAIIAATALLLDHKPRKLRIHDKNRETAKSWWDHGYANWSEDDFAKRMRIKRGVGVCGGGAYSRSQYSSGITHVQK